MGIYITRCNIHINKKIVTKFDKKTHIGLSVANFLIYYLIDKHKVDVLFYERYNGENYEQNKNI